MSEIDWSRLRSITARQIVSALERDGFALRNQSGSHQRYQHADGRRVTVSYHRPSEIFRPKTLRSIVEMQARWTEGDLRRLKLLR